jgi:hypothetical protein
MAPWWAGWAETPERLGAAWKFPRKNQSGCRRFLGQKLGLDKMGCRNGFQILFKDLDLKPNIANTFKSKFE